MKTLENWEKKSNNNYFIDSTETIVSYEVKTEPDNNDY